MKSIKSANNYGWVVDSSEADDALEMWLDYCGGDKASVLDELAQAMSDDVLKENVEWIARHWGFAEDIEDAEDGWGAYETAREIMGADSLYDEMTRAIGSDELAEDLAYIFRMNDFREWDERNGGEEEEIESACHGKGKKKDKKEIKSAKENGVMKTKIVDYSGEKRADGFFDFKTENGGQGSGHVYLYCETSDPVQYDAVVLGDCMYDDDPYNEFWICAKFRSDGNLVEGHVWNHYDDARDDFNYSI